MAASVLAGSETVLHNVPDLKDVTITLRILRHLGCTAERDGDTVRIDSRGMNRDFIPHDLMRELRSSVIFLGAILTRFGTASLSMPGGCELGPRPVNLHLDALRALGAEVTERGGTSSAARTIWGARRILLPFPSVGATENAMLAACAAAGGDGHLQRRARAGDPRPAVLPAQAGRAHFRRRHLNGHGRRFPAAAICGAHDHAGPHRRGDDFVRRSRVRR